jgi:hypothetical protein
MLRNILFLSLFLPQIGHAAGFVLNPALGLYKVDNDNGVTQLELRVGYAFDFGLYLGGFYELNSQKFVEDADEFYAGVHVGYECHGIYGLLGYVIAGDQDLKSGGIKYTGATGYLATVGYRALLTEDVYLGPELTYRNVSFEDQETQGVAASIDRHDAVLIPGIAVYFAF